MFFFVEPLRKIFSYRRILFSTTISEIKKKYAGSMLGIAWAFLYPLLFLGVYAVVYSYVLKIRYEELTSAEYILVIFCGLIPYLGFNESVSMGTMSVTANSGLIKNTMFPIELVPVRTVFCAQTTQGAGMLILLLALLIMGKGSLTMLLIFPIWFLQLSMELGIVWILSSINVIMKDLQNVIGIIMLMIMMASPIAYSVSEIPMKLRVFMHINPIYNFIISNQCILLHGEIPERSSIIGMIVWGPCIFFVGYCFFIKMKRVFVDNV